MADYQIKVSADTQQANAQLIKTDKIAEKATQPRNIKVSATNFKEIEKNYKKISESVKGAANDIKMFYGVSKKIPVFGDRVQEVEALAKGTAKLARNAPAAAAGLKESANAGNILSKSMQAASGSMGTLITNLAKVGFAIYAVNTSIGFLAEAYNGFFQSTIGREIQLQETILKTQTALASTSKVFRGSTEITDPYEKIVTLTSQVEANIDSIRERSLELAGVTSGDVIEVFGMVAQQIGQIGGGLDEAEDLAIKFSAALGTFGIPLYQARQEIGSILRGDITQDSYLAKALGITNEDIQKAKSDVDGVMGFLDKRLAASVAGQRIAAQSFSGVTSNIAEIFEEVGRLAGKPLLAPLLSGLSIVYDSLFSIFKQLKDIGTAAGQAIATLTTLIAGGIGEGSKLFTNLDFSSLATGLQAAITSALSAIQADVTALLAPVSTLFNEITEAVLSLGQSLASLAIGFADVSIEVFKSLVQVLANLAQILQPVVSAFSALLSVYGKLLQQPIVQYFSQIAATMKILEVTGATSFIKLALGGVAVAKAWKPVALFFARFVTQAKILFARLAIGVSKAFATMAQALMAFAATLEAADPRIKAFQVNIEAMGATLNKTAVSANKAGVAAQGMATGVGVAAKGIKAAIVGLSLFLIKLIAIQVAISLVIDLFGRWQQRQQRIANTARAAAAVDELTTKFKDQTEELGAADKAYKKYLETLANAEYTKSIEEVGKLTAKIEELKATLVNTPKFGAYGRTPQADIEKEIEQIKEERKKLVDFIEKYESAGKKEADKELVKTMAENRSNMEKQLKELRKKLIDDEFRYRNQAARLGIEAEKLRAELILREEERRNAKRLEGEEGASRVFLSNLQKYLQTKKRGELDIAMREKELEIAMAELAKQASDYQLQIQKQIAELQKKMGKYQKEVADYQASKAKEAANARTGEVTTGAAGGLVDLISNTESFGGNYGAFNRGGSNEGHTAHGSGIDPTLQTKQIKDIMAQQRLGASDPNVLHAVGKYQIIKATMEGLMSGAYGATGVTPESTFSPANQDKLFAALARNRVVSENVQATMAGLRSEWVGLQGVPDEKLRPAVEQLMKGVNSLTEATTSTPAPEPMEPDTAIEVDASGVEGAMDQIGQMKSLVNSLQDDLKADEIQGAFESTFQGAFATEPLEQYEDQLNTITGQMQTMAENPLTDPAQAQLKAQIAAQQASIERERLQIVDLLAEAESEGKIDAEQRVALEEQMNTAIGKREENLGSVLEKRLEVNSAQRALNALTTVQNEALGIQDQIEGSILMLKLKMSGASQAEISLQTRLLSIEKQRAKALIGITDPKAIAAINTQYDNLIAKVKQLGEVQKALENPIVSLMSTWKQELSNTSQMVASLAQSIQSSLATGMANAITGLIDGTQTVEEAMADMFKNIGRAFIEMATQMIAKALMMQVLGIFMPGAGAGGGFLGGLFGGGGGGLGGLLGLAEGGYVSGPTPALIGEGGENEYVIPESKMDASMQRWGSGARGDQVLQGGADAGGETSETASEPYNPNINISGGVLNFNGSEYISKEELPGIILQASKQGEARTLNRLRNSPTTRRKLSI